MLSLSRKKANRESLIRNQVTSLILYERITTTAAKAKTIKGVAERLILSVKTGDINERRRLMGFLFDENATKKVIEVFLPRYKDRKSGIIKTYRISNRLGDGAPRMIVQLINDEPINKEGEDEASKSKNEPGRASEKVKEKAAGSKQNKTTGK